jgi:capsular polysaccharide biosynthesis protein
LIEIAVVDTDAKRAQAVANELADQLIHQAPTSPGGGADQRQAFINSQLDDLETKITQTQDEVTKKQTELANLFSARQIADAQAQITALQQKLVTLQGNYAAMLANTQRGAINSLAVIEPARLPSVPIGPNRRLTIFLAAVIGLILAVGAAYLLEYMDDTLKNPEEVQKVLGLTTLGAVPQAAEVSPANELIVLSNSQSPATEAYRVLRTNLQFAAVDRPLRTL